MSNLLQALLLFAADAGNTSGLTIWGWTIMILSVGSVVALASFCTFKVLTLPPVEMEDIKGPLGTDTKDTVDAD